MLKPTDDSARDAAATPAPYIYRRIVHWGDTDPARIVFTARFLQYALDGIEMWFKDMFGYDWYELNLDLGIGTPFRFANLDFRAPVTPRHRMEIEIRVSRVGTTSIRFDLAGYGQKAGEARELCFTGDVMMVLVTTATLKKRPIPPEFRQKLAAAGWCAA